MSSLKKNLIYQTVYQILTIVLPLITAPYVSRVLGPGNIGIYSYTYSIAYYFVLFAMLGINNYGNRIIAQVRDDRDLLNKTFSNLFAVHAIVSSIMIILYILYCFIFIKEYKIYMIIQGIYIISALFDINWFYFGIEKFKLTVTRNTIIKIVTVICTFIFVKSENDLWIYILILALGSFISQSIVWVFLKKYVSFIRPTFNDMRIHFKPLLILFIPSIAVSLYKIMDKIMLKSLSDAVQVGYYENSEKIITIPQGIIAAVGTVMLPKMSNLVIKNDKNSMQKYLDFSIQGVMFIAIALMFGLAGIANEFAPVYFGNEFTSCGIIISGLAITIPFISFANIIRTQFLIPNSKDNVYVISVIIGAILNLSINRLLIPYFQAMGAVIGTIAAEVSVCFIQCIAVRNELPFKKYFRNILPFPLLGIIMYIAVRVIGKNMGGNFVTVIIEITTGAFIYLGLGIILFYTRNKKQVNN